jgi:hypothetical protein
MTVPLIDKFSVRVLWNILHTVENTVILKGQLGCFLFMPEIFFLIDDVANCPMFASNFQAVREVNEILKMTRGEDFKYVLLVHPCDPMQILKLYPKPTPLG